MARYDVTLSDGHMDMGALGRCRVTTSQQLEAGSLDEARQLARRDGRPVQQVVLRRLFEVKLTSKRDKRKRPVMITTATCHITAVRNVGYQSGTWRATGWVLSGGSRNWPDAVVHVKDITPDRDLGGAERLPTMTGQQVREQQLALIAPRRRRRARR